MYLLKKSRFQKLKLDTELLKNVMLFLEKTFVLNKSKYLNEWLENALYSVLTNCSEKQQSLEGISSIDLPDHISELDQSFETIGKEYINRIAVLKLNGGLGTSMGCNIAKSLLNIDDQHKFIDLILKQKSYFNSTYNINVPFLLMNSFYTHCDMKAYSKDFQMFEQHKLPRVFENSYDLLDPKEYNEIYCPPGHGNVYLALYESGTLNNLINKGIEYLFISNSDNLGATLDISILGYIVKHDFDMLMEVTQKTELDKKGGILVKKNNKPSLIERAEVVQKDVELFENIHYFKFFNTNNLWLNTRKLLDKMNSGSFNLPFILNKKMLKNKSILQFESAMGAALSLFEKSTCLEVNRNRFVPVKSANDFLLLKSNIFKKYNNGLIEQRIGELPKISLSKEYSNMEKFQQCFKICPVFDELKQLTIKGLFEFKENVVLSGNVSLVNNSQNTICLRNITLRNESKLFN